MEFTDAKLEDLVLLVQQHKCLYDMTLMSYRNKQLKENAWKNIAMELQTDGR